MRVKIWGARGSVPAPGPETTRYGGNTSCVQVTLADGTELVLDAGTGIRSLGLALQPREEPLNILLTHLHLDHIQGLLFFAPAFRPQTEIVIWGPASPDEIPLEARIARYISAPLTPVEVRELPCHVSFREAPASEWQIGSATIRAESIAHRGPTLGFRITEGDDVLCYMPDHEPGLGANLEELEPDWISGYGLAHDATLLIHDCQYSDEEYGDHAGWGHSRLTDALRFARRAGVGSTLLFHHDPLHSDADLEEMRDRALMLWPQLGGEAGQIELAAERAELTVGAALGLAHRR